MGIFPESSRSSTSSYLTPLEAANHRRTSETPPPASPQAVPNGAPSEPEANHERPSFFQGFHSLPKIVWNVHPVVRLKLRKLFYPLGVTQLTLGADYNLQTHETSLKWSWKDRLIGGRLNLNGDELSITKSFQMDKQTKLDIRCALDFHTRRTLLSVRVVPFGAFVAGGRDGALAIRQKIPVDRRLSIEVAGRVRLPEARFSAGSHASISLGEGDFIVDVDEMNLRFLLQ